MKDLVKSNEVENKPKNVEDAIKEGWKTAKEMYKCAGVCRDTFNEFILEVRNAVSKKPNSGCRIDPTANLVVKLGSAHKAYYHPKVEEAGLVKETDYAERIFGEDCFPTTMISESGIDKIYDCYDR